MLTLAQFTDSELESSFGNLLRSSVFGSAEAPDSSDGWPVLAGLMQHANRRSWSRQSEAPFQELFLISAPSSCDSSPGQMVTDYTPMFKSFVVLFPHMT